MKKLLALLFALTMVLALAACGGSAETEPAETEETETTEAARAIEYIQGQPNVTVEEVPYHG